MIDVERFRRLSNAAADGLKERGEIVAGALLTVLSGQSVFFYGPPGTAKSLIARRLAGCFKSSSFFECLMNRFTTPEKLFGPVSIHELKTADRYVRKTDGFLPSVDFAFLDEIWKSSPAILNALLTIMATRWTMFRSRLSSRRRTRSHSPARDLKRSTTASSCASMCRLSRRGGHSSPCWGVAAWERT